jgi:dipeptidase D
MNVWTKGLAALATAACACTAGAAALDTDEAIIDDFLGHFEMLAAVPRPSTHEKAISDTLKAWAENLGFEVKQNAAFDLVFDVPATEGLEDLPLVALQAHIDMVCVARDGRDYDPENDPIRLVVDREAGTLTADGTSLGADDGAGVAIVMSIAEGKMAHGPLRVFFTADEEIGMTGALALSAEDLRGVKYLLNIDSEASDAVTVSSAADAEFFATCAVTSTAPSKGLALRLAFAGGSGGHSGLNIGEGRCNGIVALAKTLALLGKDIPFELASFRGGTAKNAIPAKAEAVIVIDPADRRNAEEIVAAREEELKELHAGTDPALSLALEETMMPEAVQTGVDTFHLVRYTMQSIDGVNTMSAAIGGLVESSCNLGQLEAGPDRIWCAQLARSSDAGKLREIEAYQKGLAAKCGFALEIVPGSKAWPVNPASALVPRICGIYRELTGKEMRVEAIHAGLECGVFAELDGGIDIASIGPDLANVHSPDETLRLASVPLVWHLLEKLLANLD